jgi:hypothetical protein
VKNMRHHVDVMRPPPHQNQKGDSPGQDQCVIHEWPCSITTLTGRELERAQQIVATAELTVEGYGDPKKPIQENDYLEFVDGVKGTKDKPRKLNVMAVIDENQNGLKLKLLCGEERL